MWESILTNIRPCLQSLEHMCLLNEQLQLSEQHHTETTYQQMWHTIFSINQSAEKFLTMTACVTIHNAHTIQRLLEYQLVKDTTK